MTAPTSHEGGAPRPVKLREVLVPKRTPPFSLPSSAIIIIIILLTVKTIDGACRPRPEEEIAEHVHRGRAEHVVLIIIIMTVIIIISTPMNIMINSSGSGSSGSMLIVLIGERQRAQNMLGIITITITIIIIIIVTRRRRRMLLLVVAPQCQDDGAPQRPFPVHSPLPFFKRRRRCQQPRPLERLLQAPKR